MVWIPGQAQTAFDSLKLNSAKHFFNTVITLDGYRKPSTSLKDTTGKISRRLGSYGVKQFYLSFYSPLFTDTHTVKGNVIRSKHLLLTGNLISLRPVFEDITQHVLVKWGVGLRYIYNSGKKGVWFIDVSPFVTRDVTFRSKAYYRLSSTVVYSHNVSRNFNWRLGITKSFTWGNRLYLPFIGLRIGSLDKTNLSIQFPRSINLNIPLSPMWILSVYSRPQGGMYTFSNGDSLYFRRNVTTFHFTRYEIISGLRVDVRATEHFNFYVAAGISSKNNITFYSDNANRARLRLPYNTYFYSRNASAGVYLNLGLVFRLGKTRTYLNDKNMYDALDMNNTINNNRNNQVPIAPARRTVSNLKSISDLVDYNDL
jgi:hypothetical protein